MKFVKHFRMMVYNDSLMHLEADIREYCKKNYCDPVSVTYVEYGTVPGVLAVLEYRGRVAKKMDTDKKIPDTNKYYHKCSKCGFHLIEDEMTICHGCASHFVEDLEVE